MNGCIGLLIALLSLVDDPGANVGARKSFELSPEGQWKPLAPSVSAVAPSDSTAAPATTRPTDPNAIDPEIGHLAALVRAGQFQQARLEAIEWLKENPSSPNYDRGLLVTAEALRGLREYIRGFYYCDQLLDEHPDSPLFQAAIEMQYELADAFLLGAKDRFLGMHIVDRKDEAVEMLFRIQQRAPGSSVAEKALLRTADYYWANGDFDLASDAYHSYAQSYPRSPLVPQARLREAYANLAQFHGPTFDSTPAINAKALMRQIQSDYPELAKQEAMPEKVDLVDRQMARKMYLNADFYRRTGKPNAAVVLCHRLIKQYPDGPEAKDAQAMLARLERKP